MGSNMVKHGQNMDAIILEQKKLNNIWCGLKIYKQLKMPKIFLS